MRPELRRVGNTQSPVVVIDDFSGEAEEIAAIADALAPFPPINSANYYPGVRRIIEPADAAARTLMSTSLAGARRNSSPERSTSTVSTCLKRASRW